MENKNSKFNSIVSKMETLKETETGKLKGGFAVLQASSFDAEEGNNIFCPENFICPKKPEKPKEPTTVQQ